MVIYRIEYDFLFNCYDLPINLALRNVFFSKFYFVPFNNYFTFLQFQNSYLHYFLHHQQQSIDVYQLLD